MRKRTSHTSVLLLVFTASVVMIAVLAQDRSQLPVLVAAALVGTAILARLWWHRDITLADVLLYAIIFRLLLVWLPPSLSDDAFRYVWDGFIQVHGFNPYELKPEAEALAEFHHEEVYERLNSKSFFSVYPPLSQYVFFAGGLVYEKGWLVSHFAIKVILVLAELAAIFILSRLVSARSLMLYAWNPLVLIETAGQGHTESLLLLLVVLTISASRAGKAVWASVALAAGTWVKLLPLVMLPFLWRRFGWRSFWVSIVVLGLLAGPFAAPYVIPHVRESLDLYAQYFEFNAGFYYFLKQAGYWLTGLDQSKQIGPALRWCFIAALPVLYSLDFARRWSLEKAFLVCIGCYLVLSTTVHPWYLLSILFLATFCKRVPWPWFWVGGLSLGTYMLYSGGPYWSFVTIGWGGGLVLAMIQYGPGMLQSILEHRAQLKVRFIRPYLPRLQRPLAVLDLGCGEGYVGAVIQREMQADVVLTDIVDMNKTRLPHTLCSPRALPWQDKAFDVVVLYFVLHHAEDAEAVVQEALRVACQRVIVVESVYLKRLDHMALILLDVVANRIRSWHKMKPQEKNLAFRTASSWRKCFEAAGMSIIAEARKGRFMHRQHLFVLEHQPSSA